MNDSPTTVSASGALQLDLLPQDDDDSLNLVEIVASRDGKVVGQCTYREWDGAVDGGAVVTVVPAARKQGLGQALIARLIQELRLREHTEVVAVVEETNEASIRLLERTGFHRRDSLKSDRQGFEITVFIYTRHA